MATLRTLLRPPDFGDEDKNRTSRQLYFMLLITIGLFLVLEILFFFDRTEPNLLRPQTVTVGGLALMMVALILVMRRGRVHAASVIYLSASWLALFYLAWDADGILDVAFTGFFVIILGASMLLGWRGAIAFTVLSILAGWLLAFAQTTEIIPGGFDTPFNVARDTTAVFVFTGVFIYFLVNNLQEVLQQARQNNRELQQLSTDLELRVVERTQTLAERTQELALAAEVGQRIAAIRNLDPLLQEAVNLIRDRFDLYFAQIYLVNDSRNALRSRAGTGQVGETLQQEVHRLPISTASINGTAALQQAPVLVTDTRRDPRFRPHPLLPDTLSELAMPLLIGSTVLGVLDLQSAQVDGLSEASLPAFTAVAGQLAVAIRNAQLFAERQMAAEALVTFRLGFERSASAIFLTDIDGKIIYINPAFTDLYGYTEAEVQGKTPRILKSGVLPQEYYEHFWQTLLSHQVISGEIVNKAKDGRLVQVAGNNNPILNDEGNIVGFLGMHIDITENKQSEEALARRVAELNSLNDIGRKAEERPPLPAFLRWVATEIPSVLADADICKAAITLHGDTYGDAEAGGFHRHIVEGIRVGQKRVGHLTIAYTDETRQFADEDSAFIGGVGRRISSYVESQQLLQELADRASELETVAAVSTAVATELQPEQLLQTFVNLTKEKFDLYHAHIYLLDLQDDTLRLAAGAGEIGRQMVAAERRVSLRQQQSLVAQAARRRSGVVVNDVRTEADFLPHPLLPDTRSEMAVPLLVTDQLLGVLDVQADTPFAFDDASVSVFTTLAAQMGVALQNAYQYEQTQSTLQEVSALQRAMTRQGWENFLTADKQFVYGYMAGKKTTSPVAAAAQAKTMGAVSLDTLVDDETAVSVPVHLGETSIGRLGVRVPADQQLTASQTELLQSLSDQVGQALERARLSEQTQVALDESQQLSDELSVLNEMGRGFTAASDLDGIISTIYEFTGQLMDAADMYVALYDPELDEVDIRILGAGEESIESAMRRRGGNGITEYVIRQRQALLIEEDGLAVCRRLGIEVTGRAAQSWLGVPVMLSGQVLGMIAVQHFETTHVYDAHHQDLLTTVANQAAIAIENARLLADTTERAREEQMLREVTTRVNTAVDAESILRTAAEEIGKALGMEAFVMLNDPTSNGENGSE